MAGKWDIVVKTKNTLEIFTNPQRFIRRFDREFDRSFTWIAAKLTAHIKRNIRRKVFKPNRALTTWIKGSTTPLVGIDADLFKGITWRKIKKFEFEVGVLRTNQSANIGWFMHEGGTIPVTPKMRTMFKVLAEVSRGVRNPNTLRGRAKVLWEKKSVIGLNGWKALNDSTRSIKIPGRPFIRRTFDDRALLKENSRVLEDAINRAMTGRKTK